MNTGLFTILLNHIPGCNVCSDDTFLSERIAAYWGETYELHIADRQQEIGFLISVNHQPENERVMYRALSRF